MLITCAAAFAWFARMQVKGAGREKISASARSMARLLADFAAKGLRSAETEYDSPLQDWFKPFSFSTGEAQTWVVRVVPLDDKIPLRHLFLPDGSTLRSEFRDTWEEIWNRLGHPELAYAVLDFLDGDTRPKIGGAERATHLNRQLLDISELLILEEMTPEILYGTSGMYETHQTNQKTGAPGLADYCTLWSGGKVNLNSAPVQVLEVLSGMDRTLARNVDGYRRTAALTDMDDLEKMPGFPAKSRAALMNAAGFASRYFAVQIEMQESGGGTSFNIVIDKTDGTIVRWEEI